MYIYIYMYIYCILYINLISTHPYASHNHFPLTCACSGPYGTSSPSTVRVPRVDRGCSLKALQVTWFTYGELTEWWVPLSMAKNNLSRVALEIPARTKVRWMRPSLNLA